MEIENIWVFKTPLGTVADIGKLARNALWPPTSPISFAKSAPFFQYQSKSSWHPFYHTTLYLFLLFWVVDVSVSSGKICTTRNGLWLSELPRWIKIAVCGCIFGGVVAFHGLAEIRHYIRLARSRSVNFPRYFCGLFLFLFALILALLLRSHVQLEPPVVHVIPTSRPTATLHVASHMQFANYGSK